MAQKVGDLYFALGLDDKDFENRWKKALAKYENTTLNLKVALDKNSLKNIQQQLGNIDLKSIVSDVQNLNSGLSSIKTSLKGITGLGKGMSELSKAANKAAISSQLLAHNMRNADTATKSTTDSAKRHSGVMKEILGYVKKYVSLWGAMSVARSIVSITGEIEYQRKALESVMQSAEKAKEVWNEIQGLAVKSPFQIPDLLKYSKQLSAFGIQNEELFDTLKRLADVSAGLGVDLSRIALAYGEINAATVLRGKEARQLTQAGIPIIRELAASFSELEGRIVSAGEVYERIFSRQVSFDMVKKVFTNLTSEGGKFYQMQEKQAATLKGSIKNLSDNWTLMANQIGESNSGWIKSLVEGLKSAMRHWQSWIGMVKAAIVTFVAVKGTLGAFNVYMRISAEIQSAHAVAVRAMARGYDVSTAAVLRHRAAQKMSASSIVAASNIWATLAMLIVAASAALYKWITAETESEKMHKAVASSLHKASAEATVAGEQLDYLFAKYKSAKEGTQNYKDAQQAIIRAYPEYFEKLKAEGKNVKDLTQYYEDLKNEALASANARGIADARDKIAEYETSEIAKYRDVTSIVKRPGGKMLTVTQQERIGDIIEGTYNTEEVNKAYYLEYINKLLPNLKSGGFKSLDEFDKYLTQVGKYTNNFDDWLRRNLGSRYLGEDNTRLLVNLIAYRRKKIEEAKKESAEELEELGKHEEEKLKGTSLDPNFIGPKFNPAAQGLTDWQKTVREIFRKNGVSKEAAGSLWPDVSTGADAFVSSLRKTHKEVEESLKNAIALGLSEDTINTYKNKIAAIEEISGVFKLPLSQSGSGMANTGNDKQREAVRAINEQLEWVEKVREFYQSLQNLGMSPEQAQKIVSDIYGPFANLPSGMTLSDVLSSDYTKLMKGFQDLYNNIGGDEGRRASENIQKQIAQAEAKDALDRLDKAKKLEEDLKKWGAKDFEVEGESGLFKLSKIMTDLNTKNASLALQKEDMLLRAKLAYNDEEYKQKEKIIEDLYKQEYEYNVKLAQQRVDALGDTFVKQASKELDVAFKNASKKTVGYLKSALKDFSVIAGKDFGVFDDAAKAKIQTAFGIKKDAEGILDYNAIRTLSEDDFQRALDGSELDKTEKESLQVLYKISKELDLKGILKAIANGLGIKLSDAEQQVQTIQTQWANKVANWASKIGSTIGGSTGSTLGSAIGTGVSIYNELDKAKTLLKTMNGKDKDAALAAKNQMYMAGVQTFIEGASNMYSMISSQIKQNKQVVKSWNDAIRAAAQATRLYAIEVLEYKESNVWGVESPYKKIQAAGMQYVEAMAQMGSLAQEIAEKGKLQKGVKTKFSADNAINGSASGALAGLGVGLAAGAATGAVAGSVVPIVGTIVGAALGAVVGLFSRKKTPTYKKLKDAYSFVYDPETFELNPAIINDYAKMNDETKQLIDNWKEIKDQMKEASDEMDNQIKELTGNMGNDIKEMLVNAFSDGDIYAAIDNIDDYLASMMKNLAIQSAYAAMFEDIFKTLQERIKDSLTPGIGDQNMVDDILWFREQYGSRIEGFKQLLEAIQDQMDSLGLNPSIGSGSTTSSSAISSVTEETASRLLGLINAIRADVSVKREMMETYLPFMGNINDNISMGLTVLREIENNTRRGADNSGDIKDLIRSMMGVSNGSAGMALNVNIA